MKIFLNRLRNTANHPTVSISDRLPRVRFFILRINPAKDLAGVRRKTMKLNETAISGVFEAVPQVFGDNRGWFYESYSKKKYEELGRNERRGRKSRLDLNPRK